jgi:hypothetical protein
MGSYSLIRPADNRAALHSYDWAGVVDGVLTAAGHGKVHDVDSSTPANQANVAAALGGGADLILYFGHGDENNWLTRGATTIDKSNVGAARRKCVVSIACKTGRSLGPDAITAGIECWLGFTIKVVVIAPYFNADPIGDAIAYAVNLLGSQRTMQQARDAMEANLDQVARDYDTGKYATHPSAVLGYFAAISMRDHVVVLGNARSQPLP